MGGKSARGKIKKIIGVPDQAFARKTNCTDIQRGCRRKYYIMNMTDKNQPDQPAVAPGQATPIDEVNLFEIAYVLVKYKVIIALLTAIGFVGGYMIAKAKGPTYISSAVVMAKESDKQMPNLGALGVLGGLAGAQLNLAGNPGLEKIEIHFDSRQFKAEMIEKYGLLNDIYKYGAPRRYKKYYDTLGGRWTEDEKFREPTPERAADLLTKKFINKNADIKRGTLTLSVKSSDSLFTCKVIEGSLEHLNRYIQSNVQKDAKDNVDFLEKQLISIADPLLREKLQGMIAAEIEKAMIISKEAFKVIDRPYCMKKQREKIVYPVMGAFGMFLVGAGVVMFFYYVFGGGNRSCEGQKWVGLIRKKLFRIF